MIDESERHIIGKTVKDIQCEETCGDMNIVRIIFTDGTVLLIKSESAGYGGETELYIEVQL